MMTTKKNPVPAAAFLTAGFVMVLAVFFSACDMSMVRSDEEGSDSGLVVGIRRLSFDRTIVGALAGADEGPTLRLTRFPPHNTMPLDAVRWYSLDTDIATVEVDGHGNGVITVVPGNLDPAGLHLEVTIRAVYVHDSSVFAEATMMVLPQWPRNRELTFNWGQTSQITDLATIEGLMRAPPRNFTQIEETGNWNLGDGILLLTGTGDADPDPVRQGGAGQAVFEIDPEYGIVPNGNPRLLGSLHHDGLDFDTGGWLPLTRVGHLRTSGSAMRVFQVMALQRPFEITVRYRSNASGDPRWIDLRFGDTVGVRVEGPESPGNAAGEQRTVSFVWDYYYDYNGIRRDRDDFVPFVFVEAIGGVQIYDLVVEYLGP